MATTTAEHGSELVARKNATSGIAGKIPNHWTLYAVILYAITIVGVLAFVAKL